MTEQNQVGEAEPDEFELDSNGYITIALWVCVDKDGAYEAGTDDNEALQRFDESVGGDEPRRLVQVNVRLRVPRPVMVGVQVPDEAGTRHVEAKASE